MALYTENQTSSSSNYRRSSSAGSTGSSGRRSAANTTASAYLVNASTMGLTGFHYSTCGAGGTYIFPINKENISVGLCN
jgi:hypothetical protein